VGKLKAGLWGLPQTLVLCHLDQMCSVSLKSHQGSCLGHISPIRFLLRVTKILGNKDGKPIKNGGGADKELLRMNSVRNYLRFC
jgi:hypothetical protein